MGENPRSVLPRCSERGSYLRHEPVQANGRHRKLWSFGIGQFANQKQSLFDGQLQKVPLRLGGAKVAYSSGRSAGRISIAKFLQRNKAPTGPGLGAIQSSQEFCPAGMRKVVRRGSVSRKISGLHCEFGLARMCIAGLPFLVEVRIQIESRSAQSAETSFRQRHYSALFVCSTSAEKFEAASVQGRLNPTWLRMSLRGRGKFAQLRL